MREELKILYGVYSPSEELLHVGFDKGELDDICEVLNDMPRYTGSRVREMGRKTLQKPDVVDLIESMFKSYVPQDDDEDED